MSDLIDEIEQLFIEAWDAGQTPLEHMYNAMVGEGNWEPNRPAATCRIYAGTDTDWIGRVVLAGNPFPCHLCGSTDKWVCETDAHGVARVFVCEHEPVPCGTMGMIRQVSTVPARLVAPFGRVEGTDNE